MTSCNWHDRHWNLKGLTRAVYVPPTILRVLGALSRACLVAQTTSLFLDTKPPCHHDSRKPNIQHVTRAQDTPVIHTMVKPFICAHHFGAASLLLPLFFGNHVTLPTTLDITRE